MKKMFLIAAMLLTFFSASAQNIVTSDTNVTSTLPSWRISVQGGYAYRLGKIDKSQDEVLVEHAKKLKSGFCYGADATWYFMNSLGAGIKYSNVSVANSEDVTITYEDGNIEYGEIADDVNIWFLGPMVSYRSVSENLRHTLVMNIGIGYMGYKDESVVIDPFTIKGNTLGYVYELGYDYSISEKMSLGATLSYVSGNLMSYQTNYDGSWEKVKLDSDSYESLVHLGLSIGLRINL